MLDQPLRGSLPGQNLLFIVHAFSSMVKKITKEMKTLTSIHFQIDFEKKMKLIRDAASNGLPLSIILRRMVDLYLSNPSFRKTILQFVQYDEEV